MKSVRSYASPDERALEELRELAPKFPQRMSTRLLYLCEGHRLLNLFFERHCRHSYCEYCGRRARTRSLAVNPITLSRGYYRLCGRRRCEKKLRIFEARADSRRRRAQYDWERQHPEIAPVVLIGHIPPQYPSVSRATLRAFLDSGEDAATVENKSDPSGLNSSIKSLGFADQVYAELRSGQVVLRRVRSNSPTG